MALLTPLPTLFQPLALYKMAALGLLLVLCFMWLPEELFGFTAARVARLIGP